MVKAFIDSDVLLDFLLGREPFSTESAKILSLADLKEIQLFTSPVVLANCYYILRKYNSHASVVRELIKMLELIDLVSIDRGTAIEALNSKFSDFEDALQSFSASRSKLEIIITRNISDYKYSESIVQLPAEFLVALKQ